MFPGPGPPGLRDPESGRPVDFDTLDLDILESTGVIDMVNDLAALGMPVSGNQILNGCSELTNLRLLGTPSTYITGLSGLSAGPIPSALVGGTPEAVGAPTHSHNPVLAAVPPIQCPSLVGSSIGPCLGTPDGWAPWAVGTPTHFLSPVLAAVPLPCAHHWLVPPLGPALGSLIGETLRQSEPLTISIVYPPN